MNEYQFYKSLGICPACKKRKPAPGRVRCPECLEKKRRYDRERTQEKNARMEADPEYERKVKEYKRKAAEKYQERHKRLGLCLDCCRPAAPGRLFCEYHLQKARNRYYKSYKKDDAFARPHLDPPQIRGRTKTDVGKLIALYNAGWSLASIAKELKVSYGTVHNWITKTRDEQGCKAPPGRTIKTRAHLDVPQTSDHVRVDVARIIEMYNGRVSYRDIAKALGISLSTVNRWIAIARSAQQAKKESA